MSDPVLDPLNEEQRRAVRHGEGPLLILAGAGSGKTRAITHRMAHLIRDRNVAPYRILGVTFTNKAAEEMMQRTRRLLSRENLQPELRTFHSFGVRLLREEHASLERGRNFTIYDAADQKNLVKTCMEQVGIDPKQLKPRSVVNRIGRLKDQLMGPEDYARQGDEADPRLLKLYRSYEQALLDNNAFDFGDLILRPVRLFHRNDEVRDRWQRRFRHLLVDEFQDTNPAQYRLAQILSQHHRNIAVVGDDDQSIYSWRGADVTNILNFEQDFPETKTIRLERNYRSTQPILDAAHSVIENNTERKPKQLWTEETEGEPPTVYEARSDYDEAEYVLETIQTLRKMRNISPGDCAIFFRTNAQTRVFEEVFMREGMPYVIVSGVGFYERKEIKDLMAYLKVIVNPHDDQALQRIINTPTRGIGRKTTAALQEHASKRGVGWLDALNTIQEDETVSGRAKSSLAGFRELVRGLRQLRDDPPHAVLKRVLDETGYIPEEVESEDDSTAESRVENIDELLGVAKNFEQERPDPSLAEFVEETTLLSDVDTFEEQKERVNLMTLHSAKGLEFPVVFMAGMEEGLLPHGNSEYDEERLEEERRLCYVGFTRAQRRLYCTLARRRWMYGSERKNDASRFLREAGLVDSAETESDPFAPPRPAGSPGTATPEEGTETKTEVPFSPGDTVKHPKFGEGTLVELSGSDESPVAKIRFNAVGVKRLALSFAPLEKA